MITEEEAQKEIFRLADKIYSCGDMVKILEALTDAFEMGKEVGQAEVDTR